MLRKVFLSIFILISLSGSPVFAGEVLEKILAVVNDEVITDRDLQVMMAPVVAQYRAMYTGPELEERVYLAREEFLNKIIDDKLILSEAKAKKVIVSDVEVDDMLADVRNKFPTRELFLKAIEDQGLTERKLRERFRDQLMSQKLVSFEVRSRISVSPGEVAEYYKEHQDEFAQGDRVRLQQILIRTTTRPDDEAKTFAQSLAAKIKAGESFEELAKNYSEGAEAKEGGDMGWVEKGQFLGDIDAKIFATETGQITPPVKSTLGYHIFKVIDREQLTVKPIADVRADIQDRLFKMKLKERLTSWIQELKKSAYISIR